MMNARSQRQTRSRKRRLSVTITEDDLKVLAAYAKREHEGNISAALHEMVDAVKRQHAISQLLEDLGADEIVSAEELAAIRREIYGPLPTKKRRRVA